MKLPYELLILSQNSAIVSESGVKTLLNIFLEWFRFLIVLLTLLNQGVASGTVYTTDFKPLRCNRDIEIYWV